MNYWKVLIAVLGGFQFGYTIAIMAGALLFLVPEFALSPFSQGFVVSSVLIGALAGTALGGVIADVCGRKKAQQWIALLFLAGAIIAMKASSLEFLVLGRIIQGLAAGCISVVGPMYLAELSQAASRGRFVSYYQLAVTFGILCAYTISYLLSGEGLWRWMFGFGIFPAVIHGVGFIFLPDSTAQTTKPAPWKELLKPALRSSLIAILFINIFQQITGINAVLYFAPSIFQLCGFQSPSVAIFSAVLIGVVNFLSTLLAMFLIDKKGRKPLLLVGIAGMTISLLTLAASWAAGLESGPWLAVGSLMLYVGCFALGLGPIPQLMAAELFPTVIRSRGVTLAMFSSWIFNFLVVFTFMDLTSTLSHAGTFLLYAIFGMIAFYFTWRRVPETKGVVLH